MNRVLVLVCFCISLFSADVQALVTKELIMVRSKQDFPETMLSLQAAIKKQGYSLSRVQRVDIGLTAYGYETDKYRVVFFGKTDEVHELMRSHPEFIPYLPLKIAIFAEAQETVLVTSNPLAFIDLYPDKDLEKTFRRWQKDLVEILNSVQFSD